MSHKSHVITSYQCNVHILEYCRLVLKLTFIWLPFGTMQQVWEIYKKTESQWNENEWPTWKPNFLPKVFWWAVLGKLENRWDILVIPCFRDQATDWGMFYLNLTKWTQNVSNVKFGSLGLHAPTNHDSALVLNSSLPR